jgi:hypothetical protein
VGRLIPEPLRDSVLERFRGGLIDSRAAEVASVLMQYERSGIRMPGLVFWELT